MNAFDILEIYLLLLVKTFKAGIGHILISDMLDFIQEVGVIKRLELQVQKRNERAIHLYQKKVLRLNQLGNLGKR
jgi:ribosomal protein S18 acetylase RimI-like enzyme